MPFSHLCSICSRPAQGYHYDVISCKGCKTFFRRMWLSKIKEMCPLNNKCFDFNRRINMSLSKCRACRFQRCLNVGMNPAAIQCDGNPKKDSSHFRDFDSIDEKIKNIIDTLTYVELKLENYRKSAYNPVLSLSTGLDDLIEGSCSLSLAEIYGPMSGWPLGFEEHQLPSSSMRNVSCEEPCPVSNRKYWTHCNMLTTIEYFKTFKFFHELSSRDKFVLARHTLLLCQNLHISHYTVSHNFDSCLQPDGSMQPKQDERHYPIAMMSIEPLVRCKIQHVEYVLLKAICFCNPAVPELSQNAQRILAKERYCFADILINHCLRNYTDGPGHFAELIGIFNLLETQQRMFKDLHIMYVVPLMNKFSRELIKFLSDVMDV
ncbi:Nuclear Hormone Receptor family [Caenorhabditis elegans]|uniref:Nuclear Hormone Receptor family n=2 Tax=Caenorhabditis elegans TaxID=6239 RepID=A0A131MB42_CAEEL|nr:Nuclear Hormone Receptor family [Caenorhabditis elegans]CZR14538.1 Nuclear Hormone Receptor family [Caenorhabditis elegans]|eukprot:NP_504874.2 Nuclear Hormone Receptor family [Caenorhabditis elegans]